MTAGHARPVGLVYTGGTFGMRASTRGYVPAADLPERTREEVAGLLGPDMPPLEWIDHGAGPPINSADATPAFWHALAGSLHAHAGTCSGFVIVHGTDTLAYTGAALSFALAADAPPVALTAARRPLGEDGSDAGANLRDAVRVADSGVARECCVVFGGRVLRANRTTKRHGDADNPLSSPCAAPVAVLDSGGVRPGDAPALPAPDPVLGRARRHQPRVVVVAVFPGIDGAFVDAVADAGAHAIVLEAYPSAIGPGGDRGFVDALARARRRGILVAAVSQARTGFVRLGRYAASTALAEAGVIGAGDMTREAAVAKLDYLLGTGLEPEAAEAAFQRNLRGELGVD